VREGVLEQYGVMSDFEWCKKLQNQYISQKIGPQTLSEAV